MAMFSCFAQTRWFRWHSRWQGSGWRGISPLQTIISWKRPAARAMMRWRATLSSSTSSSPLRVVVVMDLGSLICALRCRVVAGRVDFCRKLHEVRVAGDRTRSIQMGAWLLGVVLTILSLTASQRRSHTATHHTLRRGDSAYRNIFRKVRKVIVPNLLSGFPAAGLSGFENNERRSFSPHTGTQVSRLLLDHRASMRVGRVFGLPRSTKFYHRKQTVRMCQFSGQTISKNHGLHNQVNQPAPTCSGMTEPAHNGAVNALVSLSLGNGGSLGWRVNLSPRGTHRPRIRAKFGPIFWGASCWGKEGWCNRFLVCTSRQRDATSGMLCKRIVPRRPHHFAALVPSRGRARRNWDWTECMLGACAIRRWNTSVWSTRTHPAYGVRISTTRHAAWIPQKSNVRKKSWDVARRAATILSPAQI